jgi:glycine cleavage system H protein
LGVRKDCRYSESHEWFRAEGDLVTIGITKFAADELTDITYVELPEKGAAISAGESFGEIESVKATSELLSAVAGTVVARNEKLGDHPELVNDDPQGEGWMIQVKCKDTSPLAKLMDAAAYEKMIGG